MKLRYGHFDSQLRFGFKHASAHREKTQNVIVSIEDNNALIGYGEGCPREYVTGEDQESCFEFFEKHGTFLSHNIKDLAELEHWVKSNTAVIDKYPSAFCALEMALLDLMARQKSISIERLLKLPDLETPLLYSAILGANSLKSSKWILRAYRSLRFTNYKLKISGDLVLDRKRLELFPKNTNLRLDANNLWSDPSDCISYVESLNFPIRAIEEPITPFDSEAINLITKSLNIPVILDESCLKPSHITPYLENPNSVLVNIRVSKCGGILRSIHLAKACVRANIAVILGAHVGETSLLTRAMLTVGQGLDNQPFAREGAFGEILLRNDLTSPSLRFGMKGRFYPTKYDLADKHGLGIEINISKINYRELGSLV